MDHLMYGSFPPGAGLVSNSGLERRAVLSQAELSHRELTCVLSTPCPVLFLCHWLCTELQLHPALCAVS